MMYFKSVKGKLSFFGDLIQFSVVRKYFSYPDNLKNKILGINIDDFYHYKTPLYILSI